VGNPTNHVVLVAFRYLSQNAILPNLPNVTRIKDIYRYSKVKSNGVFSVILGNYIIANIGSVEKLW
jgi:hypothetical protein